LEHKDSKHNRRRTSLINSQPTEQPAAHSIVRSDTGNKSVTDFCLPLLSFLQPDCLVTNLQGKILFSTPVFQDRLGNQDISGASLLEFVPINKQQDLLFIFKSLSDGTTSKQTELHLTTTAGSPVKLKVSIRRFSDEKNKPLLFIASYEPPPNPVKADEDIHRLKSIIEQSPLSLTITDLDGNIQYVNTQFERITGYMRDEVLGKNPRILKSGETPKSVYESLWQTITSGKTWKGEFRNRKKNGEHFWELTSISPLKDDSGNITHYIAIKEDISVRKAIFERFAEGEEHLRIIVESTGDVLYKYSYVDDCFEYMNPAIAKLTGYTVDELNQIKLSGIVQEISLFGENSTDKAMQESKSIYGERGDYRAEYLIRTKSGEMRWVEDHSYPRYDSENFLIGSVGILSDITQRKQIEFELKHTKEEAESMNRLKDVFLSNMSHELRTPMISIIGYSDILHDIAGDDETKEISSILHQSALRLTDTINTILDLSMLESGSLYLQLNKVDIGDILEKIGRSYSEKIGKKTIKLINNIPPATFFVEADLRLLMQVIDNVFNNALKYTETGSVTFSAFRDAGNIIFSVADTGIGIKKEHFAIIFEEFRQVSEGLDRRYEGSGLGLHVSKRFVEKMNGKIWVDSEFGKGSTFYVSLKEFSVS